MNKARKQRVVVIGGGIGGLASAILLAKSGYQVELHEQLPTLGGRARQLKAKGFTFDMGPSWYLMPAVFQHFYELIGEDITKHISLRRLSPAYKVFFESEHSVTVSGAAKTDAKTFEAIEPGAGDRLTNYIERAGKIYKLALDNFLYTNFEPASFLKKEVILHGPAMLQAALQPIDSYISRRFSDQRLRQILEYPMVFLGASPFKAPALYSLMSYLDFADGVYYPKGGLHAVIDSLVNIAKKNDVNLQTNSPVSRIVTENGRATAVRLSNGREITADIVISNGDLHFTETRLLDHHDQSYPDAYWQARTNGPSALLLYLGIKGKLPQLEHHNLFFVDDWRQNFEAIFDYKTWPQPGSMYICRSTATDKTVAPKGHENIFVLVPLPARVESKASEHKLAEQYLKQFKTIMGEPDLDKRIIYKKIFGPSDFAADYNAWQGSALGLSHTLKQSALFRPANHSKKVSNLYYVGGNTLPGVGLPMCLISAELVLKRLAGIQHSRPLERLEPLI